MFHYRIFECKDCGKNVNLCHAHIKNTYNICDECEGELKDTGRERYDIQWAIYVGVHKVYDWEGYL